MRAFDPWRVHIYKRRGFLFRTLHRHRQKFSRLNNNVYCWFFCPCRPPSYWWRAAPPRKQKHLSVFMLLKASDFFDFANSSKLFSPSGISFISVQKFPPRSPALTVAGVLLEPIPGVIGPQAGLHPGQVWRRNSIIIINI